MEQESAEASFASWWTAIKDTVLIPVYWRPWYLDKCLQFLSGCRGIEEKRIFLYQDNRYRMPTNRRKWYRQTTQIARDWCAGRRNWKFIQRPPHDFDTSGAGANHPVSFNAFWSMREAYEHGSSFTYMVADDVFVTPDFFEWHEAVQRDCEPHSTVAERAFKQFQPEKKLFDLSAYYKAPTNLMDGGICWSREKLAITLGYPNARVHDHRFPPNMTPDDARPMIPFVQRAYHVGKISSALYTKAEFDECGDADEIPEVMPNYCWDKVYFKES